MRRKFSVTVTVLVFAAASALGCKSSGGDPHSGVASAEGEIQSARTQTSTPVIVTLGGFVSCGIKNSVWTPAVEGESAPGTAPMNNIIKAMTELLQFEKKRSFKDVRGCYTFAPFNVRYIDNFKDAQAEVKDVDVDQMVSELNAELGALQSPELIVVGHSYGGWTAMRLVSRLDPAVPVKALITLDPISKQKCSIYEFANEAQAFLKLSAADRHKFQGECTTAPTDFGSEQIDAIAGRVGKWVNYYQEDTQFLHSSPIKDSTGKIQNFLRSYPSQGTSFDGHIRIIFDKEIIRTIRDEVEAAF